MKRSSIPLYVEVADLLRQRIVRGLWGSGDRVPTIEVLMAEFGVARVTVRQAMSILASEGLIARHRGRGTFVSGMPEETRWLRLGTSMEALTTLFAGTKPRLLMITDTIAAPPLTAQDGIPALRYRYMKRLHSQGEVPYAVIGIYLAADIFARSPKRFRNETVIPLLRSLGGAKIAKGRQNLTIGTADMETAELLRVPVNSPIAEVRRVFCDEVGRVIYLGEVRYRGDFIHLEIDLIP